MNDVACLLDTKNDFSSIVSMMQSNDPLCVNYRLGDICKSISSLPIYNPLGKGGLFNLFDKDRLEGVLAFMMKEGLSLEKYLFLKVRMHKRGVNCATN